LGIRILEDATTQFGIVRMRCLIEGHVNQTLRESVRREHSLEPRFVFWQERG